MSASASGNWLPVDGLRGGAWVPRLWALTAKDEVIKTKLNHNEQQFLIFIKSIGVALTADRSLFFRLRDLFPT